MATRSDLFDPTDPTRLQTVKHLTEIAATLNPFPAPLTPFPSRDRITRSTRITQ